MGNSLELPIHKSGDGISGQGPVDAVDNEEGWTKWTKWTDPILVVFFGFVHLVHLVHNVHFVQRPLKLFLSLSFLFFSFSLQARCLDCYSEEGTYCTLPSPGENSGMFSVFITALGFLHFYEEEGWAGAKIDFREKGLYYDPQRGSNWWEYYFEPVVLGSNEEAQERKIAHRQIHRFNRTGDRILSREEASRIVQKHIKIKPVLEKKISAFVEKNFKGHFVIGVHFRGTDKVKREAKPVPFEQVFQEIRSLISELPTKDYKIFVATDEERFLQEIKREFKERVIFSDARRSSDGRAVHFAHSHSYKTGEEAVVDCLLLSRSNYLLRTESNLSFCSGLFNPNLPIKILTPYKPW